MNAIAILILLGSFFIMIILGIHIAYAMGMASLLTLLYLDMPLITLINTMVGGINSYTYLAIPFFIIMGEIMGAGGISDRLIKLSSAIIGWMRGGLAMVNIVASVLFGCISGSATADTASLGAILIPMMKKEGYDGEFATSVTMASSVEGMLIPPSHNMIIYSMAAGGLSISGVFMGGILPGMLLVLALIIFSYYMAVKRNYPKGERFRINVLFRALGESIWGLMAVLIVVVGVLSGMFTATESAAIAVVYSFIVTFFGYREVKLREFSKMLNTAIRTLAIVLVLVASAGTFGFLMAYLKVPTLMASAILGITSNKFLIFLLINVILLLLGTVMGMAPIIIIMTPVLLPIVMELGMDPIQFGALLILNCGIGLITPPVGGVLFVGSGISGIKIEHLVKEMLPFYVVMFIVLMMVTYISAVTMTIPNLLASAGLL